MTSNPTIKWVALALVGLLIAAAVAVLGSSLASRQIGLSSEPLRAGDALAPPTISQPATGKPANPEGNGPAPASKTAAGQSRKGRASLPRPPEPVAPPAEPPAPPAPAEPTGDHHDGEGGDD